MTYVPAAGGGAHRRRRHVTDTDTLDQGGIVYDYNVSTGTAVTATVAKCRPGFSGNVTFARFHHRGRGTRIRQQHGEFQTTTQVITNTNTASYQVVRVADVVANGSTTNSTNGTGEPVTIASAAAGSTFSFTNVIWNRGNAADTFVIGLAGRARGPRARPSRCCSPTP